MTKRETLEKCKDQWQHITMQLEKCAAIAKSLGVRIEIGMHALEMEYFVDEEIPRNNIPINLSYLCQYVMDTTSTSPHLPDGLKCSECPLVGYAWSQCEDDPNSLYTLCEYAIWNNYYTEAARHAQAIVVACARAIADLT